MATTTILPTLLYGAEAWWNGFRTILDHIAPTYHWIARLITGLPRYSQLRFLLKEAGLPPLDLLLDSLARRDGVRVLRQNDDHPCKSTLLAKLNEPPKKSTTGLHKISCSLRELI